MQPLANLAYIRPTKNGRLNFSSGRFYYVFLVPKAGLEPAGRLD